MAENSGRTRKTTSTRKKTAGGKKAATAKKIHQKEVLSSRKRDLEIQFMMK